MSGHEICYFAALHKLDAAAKTATFYLMNATRNRNRWGVTEKALSEALPSLKGKKIGMGKDYKIDRHYPDGETMDCGEFVSFEDKGSYALGTAKIEDAQTLGLLEAGALGPVSVVILSYRDVCSVCGADLMAEKDVFAHKCFDDKDAYAVVESFTFKRVDFVDVPAYPQAGLLDLAANSESKAIPIELLAGFYGSQVHPPMKGANKPTETKNGGKKMSETETLDQLKTENQTLKDKIQELEQTIADLKSKQTATIEAAAALTKVTAELAELKRASHDALVADVFTVRVEAGITGKAEEEKAMLAKLDTNTLTLLKADAEKIAVQVKTAQATPKTKFSKQEGDSLLAAVNAQREQMGLAPRKELS
jgi:hypothetical protein